MTGLAIPTTPTTPTAQAYDAGYRYLSRLLARRARRLGREVAGQRVAGVFRQLCTELTPTLGLEIGAHEASFSRWLKETVPSAHCVAFEANPYVHEKYAAELAAAGVDYHHLAIADVRGTVELSIPRELTTIRGDGRFTKPRDNRMASLAHHQRTATAEAISVPSIPLDEMVTAGDHDVVVAWIDVEGATGAVLPSGAETLARASLVYVEVESRPTWDGQWLDVDVARYLATRGLVPVLRDVQRPHQYNVLFVNAAVAEHTALVRLLDRAYRPEPQSAVPAGSTS